MSSERLGIYTEKELDAARALVRELIRVVRSFRLYEGHHPSLTEMQIQLRKKWDQATTGGPLTLRLTERKVYLEDEVVHTAASGSDVLPTVLYEHGVVGLVLNRGLEPSEARRFVEVLSEEPDPGVDYASRLWEADLTHVQILLDSEDFGDDDFSPVPEEFAEQVRKLGDDKDPLVGADYDEERAQLEALVASGTDADPDHDRFLLTEGERLYVARMLELDHYMTTVRHTARIVHAMAREELTPDDAASLERAAEALVQAVVSSGDLEGALEVVHRAAVMTVSSRELEMRLGERTLAVFRERENLWAFLRGLDGHEYVDTFALGEFISTVGAPAAPVVGEWLLETRFPEVAAQAMRVYGDSATEVLVPLYQRSQGEGRERIGRALLEIGTPEALVALTPQFTQLPEESRLQVLQLVGRNTDTQLRRVLYEALEDPAERIRHHAIGALRRSDAPELAAIVQRFLEAEVLERRTPEECRDFFEVLSRIGDIQVAKVLAEFATPKGLFQGLRGLTPLQKQCVRALRRMRSRDARAVVENLRRTGPRMVRDILDDDIGDL